MEGSLIELARYRLDRAKEMLSASEGNLEIGQYKTSLNRSYYAVFHAIKESSLCREKSDYDDFMWQVTWKRKNSLKMQDILFRG